MKDKVIVVTGGAGLIGGAFIDGIANNGGYAIAADVMPKEVRETLQYKKNQISSRVYYEYLDITERESILSLIDKLVDRFGGVHAVINCAYPRNKNYGCALEDVSYEDFCENISKHLGGYFLVSQLFCKFFAKNGGGSVVNISSIYGSIAPRFSIYNNTKMTMPVEYAAIKSGVEHLTRYFAQYYKGKGIRINTISPGGVYDNQPEEFVGAYNKYCASKGLLEVSDIVGALIFLLSDNALCINGQNIVVDDGFSL